MPANPIPKGLHTLTASLTIKGAKQAIEFYKKAFGAEELMCMESPGGGVGHAELKIGDSVFFLNDEFPMGPTKSPTSLSGTTGGLQIYLENVDAAFKRAVDAGAKANMPPMDMFWGDRMSQVTDPYGHVWSISTHVEDLSEAEIAKRAAEFWEKFAAQKS